MTVEVYPSVTTVEVVKNETERVEVVVRGPQGERGETGLTGARGSNWYAGHGAPPFIVGQQPDDQYFDTDTGDTYGVQGDGVTWALEGTMPFNPGNYVAKTGDTMTGDLTLQSGHLHLGDGTISKSVGYNFDFNSGVSANELRVKSGNGVILQSPDNTAWVTIAWDSATNNALYVNYPLRLSGSIMAESASPSIFKQPGTSVGVQFEANGNDTTFVVRDTGDGAAVHSMATNSSIQANRTDSSGGARIGATGGISEVKLAGAGFHHWAIRNSGGNLQIGIADAQPEIGVGFSGTSLTFNANGDITIPQSLNAFSGVIRAYAGLALQDQPVLFRASTDGNHYIQYNAAQNGPDIAGYSGGRLGHMSTGIFVPALSWSDSPNKVNISGVLSFTSASGTAQIRVAGGSGELLQIGAGGDGVTRVQLGPHAQTLPEVDISSTSLTLAVPVNVINSGGAVLSRIKSDGSFQTGPTDVVNNFGNGALIAAVSTFTQQSPIVIRGIVSQTADLLQVQSSTTGILASITSGGTFYSNSQDTGAQLGAGNDSTGFSRQQITLGYHGSGPLSYRHAIQSRHDGALNVNNAIDFLLWSASQATGDLPSSLVLTLRGDNWVKVYGNIAVSPNNYINLGTEQSAASAVLKYSSTLDSLVVDTWGNAKPIRIGGSQVHLGLSESGALVDTTIYGTAFVQGNVDVHTNGHLAGVKLNAQDTSHTGYIEFWDDTDRKAYIGYASPKVGHDTGDLNYTAGSHDFSGVINADPTYGINVGRAYYRQGDLFLDMSGNNTDRIHIIASGGVDYIQTDGPLVVSSLFTSTSRLTVDTSGVVWPGSGIQMAPSTVTAAGTIVPTIAWAIPTDTFVLHGTAVSHYGLTGFTYNDGNGSAGVNLSLAGYFGLSLSAGGVERIRIQNSGQLIINGTNFTVDSNGQTRLYGTLAGLVLSGRDNQSQSWSTYMSSDTYRIFSATANADRLAIDPSGGMHLHGSANAMYLHGRTLDTNIWATYVDGNVYNIWANGAGVLATINSTGLLSLAGDLSVHVGGTPAKITLADGNVTKSAGVGFQFDSSVTATTVSDASGRVYSPGNPPPGGGGSSINQTQRGTIAPTGGGSATATITSVNTAKTQLRYLGTAYTSNSTTGTAMEARLALTNSTTITANWGAAATGSQTVSYELTEWT